MQYNCTKLKGFAFMFLSSSLMGGLVHLQGTLIPVVMLFHSLETFLDLFVSH